MARSYWSLDRTDMMARHYWTLSQRSAEQVCARRPAIVIYPDDSRPKKEKRAFSLLYITKQPEDALVRTYTQNTIP